MALDLENWTKSTIKFSMKVPHYSISNLSLKVFYEGLSKKKKIHVLTRFFRATEMWKMWYFSSTISYFLLKHKFSANSRWICSRAVYMKILYVFLGEEEYFWSVHTFLQTRKLKKILKTDPQKRLWVFFF